MLDAPDSFNFTFTEDEITQVKKHDLNDTLFPWTKGFCESWR